MTLFFAYAMSLKYLHSIFTGSQKRTHARLYRWLEEKFGAQSTIIDTEKDSIRRS